MISLFKDIASSARGRFALAILLVFIGMAIAAPFIAQDPSVMLEGTKAYQAPGFVSPETGRMFVFGTDQIARDVWSGIIYGSRWALLVGFLATLISAIIGLSIGLLAGYYGDKGIKMNIWLFIIMLLCIGLTTFYIHYSNWAFAYKVIIMLLFVMGQFYLFMKILSNSKIFQGIFDKMTIHIPMDFLMQRLIEIWRAVPALFILLALLAAIKQPTLWTLIIVLGLLRWTGIARLVRAELLHVREQNYIKSAKSLGFSDWHIILKHALPNALTPLFVVFAFSISGAIVLEATISFLGIGLSADTVTWGSMMSAARQNYRAWWLAVFPGVCIFLLLISLNIIGDQLSAKS